MRHRRRNSTDCQPNLIPDECEPDCDGDGIPTDCDNDEDTDDDGIDDCADQCALTTPPGTDCTCPDTVCCDHPVLGDCFFVVAPPTCISLGGTPACTEADLDYSCNYGCLWGDKNKDGDIDLRDFAAMQTAFTGPVGSPGYSPPQQPNGSPSTRTRTSTSTWTTSTSSWTTGAGPPCHSDPLKKSPPIA